MLDNVCLTDPDPGGPKTYGSGTQTRIRIDIYPDMDPYDIYEKCKLGLLKIEVFWRDVNTLRAELLLCISG